MYPAEQIPTVFVTQRVRFAQAPILLSGNIPMGANPGYDNMNIPGHHDHLFVYGTLKRNQNNHHLLKGCTYIGEAEAPGRLYDCGPFPMAVLDSEQYIHGEVYRVLSHIWGALDRLEGHPHFYERRLVHTKEGQLVWVYYYQQNVDNLLHIPEGIWA